MVSFDAAGQGETGLPMPDPAVLAVVRDPAVSLGQIVQTVLDAYGERPALLWRKETPDGPEPAFSSISYAQLHCQVEDLRAIMGSPEGFGLQPGDAVAILGFAGPEYAALFLANMASGLVQVPLPTAGSFEQVCAITAETRPRVVAASIEHLQTATEVIRATEAATVLLVLDLDEALAGHRAAMDLAGQTLAQAGSATTIMSFADALARAKALPRQGVHLPEQGTNPLSAIYYTSGSTGQPKGAMYLESNVRPFWAMASDQPQVILHYQPLSHTFGSSWVCMVLASGGQIHFTARSDLSTLLEDLSLCRPTNIALVPRVCELIYQLACAERRGAGEHDFSVLRQRLLGGRVRSATTGSAPLSPELRTFVEQLLGFPLIDGYGTTETGMIAINGKVMCPPVLDYRLLDVPDLGYFTTDKPYPRGELAVRSSRLIGGYYGRDDLNAALVDADGFYHTGDIMEEIAPGTIRYLDRRNNVLKLAQGEFVAIAKLEALFAGGSPLIRQIYLYGNSARAFLLGVVVPNRAVLPADIDEAQCRARIMDAIRTIAAEAGLQPYELPRDIIIEDVPFSINNGLLAGVGKYLRPAFRERYQGRLEALYASMTEQQDAELATLRAAGASLPVADAVRRAAAAVLGSQSLPDDPDTSFAELGGDSLSAVSLSLLLEEIFGVEIDVGEIMHPAGTLARIADLIAVARDAGGAGAGRASFAAIHGEASTLLAASDLQIGRFLDAGQLARAADLPPASTAEPGLVVLTGANGFLGRFLCLEWLERLARTGGRLVCIGRGTDDADAARRLRDAFDSGDAELLARFDSLAQGRLEVFVGDLAQPQLGLSLPRWEWLAQEADVLVHPAALVNHRLPYRQLFQPNVAGTANLIGLALEGRRKRIVNISTIAAASAAGGCVADEDADIRLAIPQWPIGDSQAYAAGYAASKWAAEVLLRDAAEHYGLPVCTFRSNMILAHRHYAGQLNVPDIFTRLLISLSLTGIAPPSFYSGDASRAHYEGLPVDFIARSVVAIGEAHRQGCHTFHVLNPHDDGISLDTVVGWLAQEGVAIRCLSDHAAWRERLEQALRALPEEQRALSSLAVISMFDEPAPAIAGTRTPFRRYAQGVADWMDAGGIPQLDRQLIAKYLDDLGGLGMALRQTS